MAKRNVSDSGDSIYELAKAGKNWRGKRLTPEDVKEAVQVARGRNPDLPPVDEEDPRMPEGKRRFRR